jgi:hypothetical protein
MRNKVLDSIEHEQQISDEWIRIEDDITIDAILRTYGNTLNRKILRSCSLLPMAIMEILKTSGIPQTTGYRRIISLINNRFLVSYDKVQRKRSKRTTRYVSSIKRLKIEMSRGGSIVIDVILDRSFVDDFSRHVKAAS